MSVKFTKITSYFEKNQSAWYSISNFDTKRPTFWLNITENNPVESRPFSDLLWRAKYDLLKKALKPPRISCCCISHDHDNKTCLTQVANEVLKNEPQTTNEKQWENQYSKLKIALITKNLIDQLEISAPDTSSWKNKYKDLLDILRQDDKVVLLSLSSLIEILNREPNLGLTPKYPNWVNETDDLWEEQYNKLKNFFTCDSIGK